MPKAPPGHQNCDGRLAGERFGMCGGCDGGDCRAADDEREDQKNSLHVTAIHRTLPKGSRRAKVQSLAIFAPKSRSELLGDDVRLVNHLTKRESPNGVAE